VPFLGWAAVFAMSSKYLLARKNRHIFNPAALAVVITAIGLGDTASWWVATPTMLPMTILGGWLIVRKLGDEPMALWFLATALATAGVMSALDNTALIPAMKQLVAESPLFFIGAIMLTEPLTTPPTRDLKRLYGIVLGVLIVPQVHLGSLYISPEQAIIAGNAFAYLISPQPRFMLQLKRKARLSPDIMDFAFIPTAKVAFQPGQYLECTLKHAQTDRRGNRRFFTIASSPTESTIHLGVRFYPKGSSYKRSLQGLNVQGTIQGTQIAGDFILPADRTRKLAFIAGGIGITPYRSMLKYLIDTQQRRDIVVLYATKTTADIIYRDVLTEAEAKIGARIMYTLTDTSSVPRTWTGDVGRLDEHMIQRMIPDFQERTFYLSGPPNMVHAHEIALRRLGVHSQRIKKDSFPGLI
jgi:ferredoxin-NADP reductase